jgi:SET domain-containing protein 6
MHLDTLEMATSSFEETGKTFWKWLEANGATLSKDIEIKDYRSEGAGRGIVAIKDIKVYFDVCLLFCKLHTKFIFKEGELLFSLPRNILLSQLTSSLKDVEGLSEELQALPGWSPLIICMMYESQKEHSFWKPYFGKEETRFLKL